MIQQPFPWQQQRPQQGPVGQMQQSGAPSSVQSGQAWQGPPQQFMGNAPGPQGQGYGWQQQPTQGSGQQGPPPYYFPQGQQMPPWMTPKMPPKGNPTKKKKALWYILVFMAIVTGSVFIGTAIYYFMKY